ncbi:hypothetical protein F511_29729 [Dorcoceras hygrometricum]|uniref:Uncharacterized protein n=1 Tax=Dorcoceras hygrometricum TaxID=472368 RepID=A0A2Z7C008_9LAMI|nr:hypothetical protein F511_29729 [Dorcoceras hygrometricum]
MSEIKRLKDLLLKEFNLISYVQELSESKDLSSRDCLPQDLLISHHDLKRVQKINLWGFYYLVT